MSEQKPTTEPLWTRKEAAAYLRVSEEYLRRSDCPMVRLPSTHGRAKRELVRYEPAAVRAWAYGFPTERAS